MDSAAFPVSVGSRITASKSSREMLSASSERLPLMCGVIVGSIVKLAPSCWANSRTAG